MKISKENIALTEKQLLAIQLLSRGIPISKVAETVDVNRSTIYKWLNMPIFRNEKKKLEEEIVQEFKTGAKIELMEILTNGKYSDKLRAIELIFKLTGEADRVETTERPMSVEDMLEALGV